MIENVIDGMFYVANRLHDLDFYNERIFQNIILMY